MDNLEAFLDAFLFRITQLSWADRLDLLLVTLIFFLMFQLVRRSQAAPILRGLAILTALLLIFTLLLPLPTFSAVVRVVALASLIVIPVILQPELRRWLERLGRNRGLFGSVQLSIAEQNTRAIVKAAEDMSAVKQGALIILEGNDSLQPYVDGGVAIKGQVSAELIESIFYGENPLHDGAVVVRDDLVEAAGCVLPLTQAAPRARRRLGTRHRAAVGLSEVSDALSVVVSEETGAISTVRYGELRHGVDSAHLRQEIVSFYADPRAQNRRRFLGEIWPAFGDGGRITLRGILSQLGYLLLSTVLALILWATVAAQENPVRDLTIPGVPLTIVNKPADWVVTTSVPATVSVNIQTDEVTLETVSPQSFQATVDLSTATLGLQRLPVVATTSAEAVRIRGVDPAQIDINLSAVTSATIPVEVMVTDPESLPSSYQLIGQPQVAPAEVTISGPVETVESVVRAVASLQLNGATTSVRTLLPVVLLDEGGAAVSGLTMEPAQVVVVATIRRENNVRDFGVRVVTNGTPPEGYWVNTLGSEPASVTLRGAPADLDALGSYVNVAPVDISEVRGEFRTLSPLELPPGIDAIGPDGQPITTVAVFIETTPLIGEIVIERPVELQGLPATADASVDPPTVQILMSGPVPVLDEIERNPELVQVYVDVSSLEEEESMTLTPVVVAPPEISTQLIEQSVSVTRES